MPYAYKDLITWSHTNSGIAEYAYLASIDLLQALASPQPPFNNPGDEVLITGDHLFTDPAYGFAKFRLAPDKNQLEGQTVGELGSQKLQFEAKIFLPGSYKEAHEAIQHLLNDEIIALIPDADCESHLYYQLGRKYSPATVTADFTTGTTVDGQKGYLATITYVGPTLLIYQGTISEPNGNQPATGIFEEQFESQFE